MLESSGNIFTFEGNINYEIWIKIWIKIKIWKKLMRIIIEKKMERKSKITSQKRQ